MGWVNIGILAGLTATAIPVVIHLLRNRRYDHIDLGTLRFLREAVRETVKWRRLQNLLLFLCRLLAVILLTLLFARPYFKQKGGDDANIDIIVLLDGSGSMEGKVFGDNLWKHVRERAGDYLSQLPLSAQATVAIFANDVHPVPQLPKTEFHPRGHTDYGRALHWARDRLALSQARHKEDILITDLQETGLPGEPLSNWPRDIPVRVFSTPRPRPFNLGVAEVTCLTPFTEADVDLQVDLAACGELPEATVEMTIEFGKDKPIRLSIPAQSRIHKLSVPAPPDGVLYGTVAISTTDDYSADDRRAFAFHIRKPKRVLLVDGDPDPDDAEPETYYLETALRLGGMARHPSAFRPTVGRLSGDLSDVDVIVLCNPADVGAQQAEKLKTFVANGGSLAIFLGDRSDQSACGHLSSSKLVPATVQPGKVPIPMPINNWDSTHLALALFASREAGNLSRIVFRDAFTIKPKSTAKVLAELENQMPAIMVADSGRGRLLLVTNPCDREWTSWPTERIFVPLMRELFAYVARLTDPAAQIRHITAGVLEPRLPGIYPNPPLLEQAPTVVAPAAEEIDVTRCDETAFRAGLGIGPTPDKAAWSEEDLPKGRERRNEIWRWLALALLVILLCETSLADRRPKRQEESGMEQELDF